MSDAQYIRHRFETTEDYLHYGESETVIQVTVTLLLVEEKPLVRQVVEVTSQFPEMLH